MQDYSNRTTKNRPIGSISGFNNIISEHLSDESAKNLPIYDHDYTLEDIYIALRKLISTFSGEAVTRANTLIQKHIDDFDNPHKTTLESMNTSVLQELYKVWLEQGNDGNELMFLKILFQYLKIADIPTTLEGTSRTEVVSVYGAQKVIETHNTDLESHTNIFNTIFPGTKFSTPCTFSLHRTVGVPFSLNVKRDSSMWIIGNDGNFKELEENTLDVDYTVPGGGIPIFGTNYNYITYSEQFNNTRYTLSNCTLVVDNSKVNIMESVSSIKMCETVTTGAEIHGITYKTGISVISGLNYTISVFIYPSGRNFVGMKIDPSFISQYPYVHFDLLNEDIYIHESNNLSNISGKVYTLPNGWYRVSMSFTSIKNGSINPEIYLLDTHIGDYTYKGTDTNNGCYIYGLQVNKEGTACPYIPTNGSVGTLEGTSLYYKFENEEELLWYNNNQGTFVINVDNIPKLSVSDDTLPDRVNTNIKSIFTGIKTSSSSIFYSKYYTDMRKIELGSYNSNSANVSNIVLPVIERDLVTLVWSYSDINQFVSHIGHDKNSNDVTVTSSLGTNLNYLYIGCDSYGSSQLDGYLYSLYYYPTACNKDQADFFLGENT